MKLILKSYLEDFKENIGLSLKNESDLFERFAAYCILYKGLYPNFSISPEDLEIINTGNYRGIDNIAFIVNGGLITSLEDIENIFKQNPRNRIKIIFEQSKHQDNFKESDINYFITIIKDFLNETPSLELSNEVRSLHEILKFVYQNFTKVESFNVLATYSYIGNFNLQDERVFLTNLEEDMNKLGIFKSGKFEIFIADINELIKLYDKTKSIEKAEFKFSDKIEIRDIEGVKEAYIGYLPYREFIKLLVDEDGKIRNLFYDNVRDFLGFETIKVNKDIKETLERDTSSFPLLNNGITIIAESNEGSGSNFILNNFQIVNGCQTSHVIYESIYKKNSCPENLNIPIKLIITNDEDLKNKIIIATNNQTQIPEEQLEALTKFQNNLEKFYEIESKELPIKVYYERRTNQYKGTSAKVKEIINIREQLKLFTSVFLEKPHKASSSYSTAYKEEQSNIFKENHTVYPYAISGFLNNYFREFLGKSIDRKYNKARYHIFLAFRIIFEPFHFSIQRINSERSMEKYYEIFKSLFRNKNHMAELFDFTIKNIMDKINVDISNQKEFYKIGTTNQVVRKSIEEKIKILKQNKENKDLIEAYKRALESFRQK